MKGAILTITAAVLMTLSFSSFANNSIHPLRKIDAKDILLTYAEATSVGNNELSKFLFTNDFEYVNMANGKTSNKATYLKFLNENKNISYNCKTEYEILDSTGTTAVAKTTYKFEHFTRVDHITLTQTKDGWKVNKVITSYL